MILLLSVVDGKGDDYSIYIDCCGVKGHFSAITFILNCNASDCSAQHNNACPSTLVFLWVWIDTWKKQLTISPGKHYFLFDPNTSRREGGGVLG